MPSAVKVPANGPVASLPEGARERLDRAIVAARNTLLRNAPRLAAFVAREVVRPPHPCTPETIFVWLTGVQFVVSKRMRWAHGVAYGSSRINLNPYTLTWASDDALDDLLLHELGHLFADRFINPREGHGWHWRYVGFILGYAPVGCTEDARRAAMRASMLTYRMAASAGLSHPELGL